MVTMGLARVVRYAGVLVAFLLLGQEPIRVTVSEVIVPVTVTTAKGQFVSNLDKEDFRIFDNGQEQTIDFFSRERNQPVVVGFLIDLSNNSRVQWKDYQNAAINLVDTLMPGGDKKYSGYLIGYSTEADLMVNTTNDSEAIVDRIRRLKPGGGSALYDALYEACTNRKLVQGEPIEPRRIVVIIGDGHDNSSKKTLNEVLELAQRNLVTIYGVSTTAYGNGNDADDDVLLKLAIATGGKVEYPFAKCVQGHRRIPRGADGWGQLCLRSGDRRILCGKANASSAPSPILPAKSPPSTFCAMFPIFPKIPRTFATSRSR